MSDSIFGDIYSFPLAILRRSSLDRNREYIREVASKGGASLCPHAKTTMSPELVSEQLEDGVWGLTAANVEQAARLISWGVKRILLANEVVDPVNIRGLLALNEDPDTEIFVLVDSLSLCGRMAAAVGTANPLNVLLEVGGEGGRAGVRGVGAALELAAHVAATPQLRLRGVEAFENVFQGTREAVDAKVEHLFDQIVEIAEAADADDLFADGEVILSAGGSTYYDRAIARLTEIKLRAPNRVVVRAGCTVTHDHGMLARSYDWIRARDPRLRAITASPEAALEVWAVVQSVPEPGLAILGAGKRDLSFDTDLPTPIKWSRGGPPENLAAGHVIVRLNDHHAYLSFGANADLRVGDMVGLGVSHPCTTFDRWRRLVIVNDAYESIGVARTYFREED